MKFQTGKIIQAALFAALICVATFSIKIPAPGTGGYLHPGDALVILAGVMLGPGYGAFAAGIGSALADLLGGYVFYLPVTVLIKGSVGYLSGVICRQTMKRKRTGYLAVILGGVADIILVGGGYYLYEVLFYGPAGAWPSLLANLLQGTTGLVIALVLYPALRKVWNKGR